MLTKKNIVILGAGESGTGAALLARQKGYEVFVSDACPIADRFRNELSENEIAFEEGTHSESRILAADEIIKSPGIPGSALIVKKIRESPRPVLGRVIG